LAGDEGAQQIKYSPKFLGCLRTPHYGSVCAGVLVWPIRATPRTGVRSNYLERALPVPMAIADNYGDKPALMLQLLGGTATSSANFTVN
jgi:hypothetical protein